MQSSKSIIGVWCILAVASALSGCGVLGGASDADSEGSALKIQTCSFSYDCGKISEGKICGKAVGEEPRCFVPSDANTGKKDVCPPVQTTTDPAPKLDVAQVTVPENELASRFRQDIVIPTIQAGRIDVADAQAKLTPPAGIDELSGDWIKTRDRRLMLFALLNAQRAAGKKLARDVLIPQVQDYVTKFEGCYSQWQNYEFDGNSTVQDGMIRQCLKSYRDFLSMYKSDTRDHDDKDWNDSWEQQKLSLAEKWDNELTSRLGVKNKSELAPEEQLDLRGNTFVELKVAELTEAIDEAEKAVPPESGGQAVPVDAANHCARTLRIEELGVAMYILARDVYLGAALEDSTNFPVADAEVTTIKPNCWIGCGETYTVGERSQDYLDGKVDATQYNQFLTSLFRTTTTNYNALSQTSMDLDTAVQMGSMDTFLALQDGDGKLKNAQFKDQIAAKLAAIRNANAGKFLAIAAGTGVCGYMAYLSVGAIVSGVAALPGLALGLGTMIACGWTAFGAATELNRNALLEATTRMLRYAALNFSYEPYGSGAKFGTWKVIYGILAGANLLGMIPGAILFGKSSLAIGRALIHGEWRQVLNKEVLVRGTRAAREGFNPEQLGQLRELVRNAADDAAEAALRRSGGPVEAPPAPVEPPPPPQLPIDPPDLPPPAGS